MTPGVKRSSVPLTGCVILGKSFDYSVPLFSNLGNGNVAISYPAKKYITYSLSPENLHESECMRSGSTVSTFKDPLLLCVSKT